MDNNSVNAVISLLMILIGFTSGLFWGDFFRIIEISNLNELICLEKTTRKNYEILNEELEFANKKLQDKLEDSENKLNSIKRLISLPPLPPPSTPLARSRPASQDDHDTITEYSSTDVDSTD